jgi:hypothetical protein
MSKHHKHGHGVVTSSKSDKSMTITRIVVDLSHQKLSAYAGSVLVYEFNCVIGRPGHETTAGKFRISRKEEMHHSHAYNNAPMPYSMFFSSDGKAIHGSPAAGLR